jgi:hypothetical protein
MVAEVVYPLAAVGAQPTNRNCAPDEMNHRILAHALHQSVSLHGVAARSPAKPTSAK